MVDLEELVEDVWQSLGSEWEPSDSNIKALAIATAAAALESVVNFIEE